MLGREKPDVYIEPKNSKILQAPTVKWKIENIIIFPPDSSCWNFH